MNLCDALIFVMDLISQTRLPNIDMYGKACNGASYYKEIKQLKITDAICESDKEYVDDAIFDLIADKEKVLNSNLIHTFDMRTDCKTYMDPYVYENFKGKLVKSHQSFIQCVYNQDILCISKEKLNRVKAEIIKIKRAKASSSKLAGSFGISLNTLSVARKEIKQCA